MLTSILRALVKNLIKESFYGKKKVINVLTVFFIFHKSNVEIFFNWILNHCISKFVRFLFLENESSIYGPWQLGDRLTIVYFACFSSWA